MIKQQERGPLLHATDSTRTDGRQLMLATQAISAGGVIKVMESYF